MNRTSRWKGASRGSQASGLAVTMLGVVVLATAQRTAPAEGSGETRTLNVHVVDEKRVPLKDVAITGDGLRNVVDPGSWYGWRGAPAEPVHTNAAGDAEVVYPLYVYEKALTSRVIVRSDLPDRAAVIQELDPAAAVPTIVMPSSPTLTVHCVAAGSGRAISGALIWSQTGRAYIDRKDWKEGPEGTYTTHRCPADTSGSFLAAWSNPEDGRAWFSKPTCLRSAASGGITEVTVELAPGVTVDGALDALVPRPVVGGRVNLYTMEPEGEPRGCSLEVGTGVAIKPDGSFHVASFPAGRVALEAWSEGWLSSKLAESAPDYFDVSAGGPGLKVPMVPSGEVRVHVEGPDGKPVAGATVSFWPNICFHGCRIMCVGRRSLEEVFQDPDLREKPESMFSAKTDDLGVALIGGLPPGRQSFHVTHDKYQVPVSDEAGRPNRYGKVEVAGGKAVETTIRLEEKGTTSIGEGVVAKKEAARSGGGG